MVVDWNGPYVCESNWEIKQQCHVGCRVQVHVCSSQQQVERLFGEASWTKWLTLKDRTEIGRINVNLLELDFVAVNRASAMVGLGCTVRGAAIGHTIVSPKLLVRCQRISNVVAVPAREIQYQVLRLSWPLQRTYILTHKLLCKTPLHPSTMDRALAISIIPRSSTVECKIFSRVFNNVGAFSPAKLSTGLNVNLQGLSRKSGTFRDLEYPIVVHSSSKRGATIGTSAKEKEETTEGQQAELQLYNTMNKQKEVFRPRVTGKVSMYVCGVTSYDYSHIGHARVYVAFDVLFRYLKRMAYEVTYVRNFTDIDDKIINRANELGEDPVELSKRFCKEFQVDMALLRCLPPSVEPRVTEHIHQIIQMILQIIENGHGYIMEEGDVYFSVDSYPSYGCLSGRKLDENRAGERVTVDSRKRNPADFALWKSTKPGEPSWDSPWGPGRPGWHIECSAMSAEHLGNKFDIHGGGMDLIFPHHENEIAQSCAACADSEIGYWLHNGFVTVNTEKMSKSLGNFFTIREVLEFYHPLALRLFLLGTHYRSPINYSKRQLELASDRLFYFFQALSDCEQIVSEEHIGNDGASKEIFKLGKSLQAAFRTSMADDLHTPITVAALSEPLKVMNDLMHTRKGRKDKTRLASLQLLRTEVEGVLSVLGFQVSSYSEVLDEMKEKALKRAGMTTADLAARLQERAAAREAKEFAHSDQIRAELAALGIALMDGGDGTQWRPGASNEDLTIA